MHTRLLATVVASMLMLGAAAPAVAAAQTTGVANHDNSRVPVQLVVLGAAALLVLVVGTGAYLARKKLGLDAPSSPEDASSHH